MSKDNTISEFWDQRVSKHHHTGWADPVIYAYDQPARLKAIESILNSLEHENNLALDFGCGTGDFTALLSKYFQQVIGFDVSEKVVTQAKIKHSGKNIIFFSGDFESLTIADHSLNLILVITVLDHILDDSQLNHVINYFRTKLSLNGNLIVMEYAASAKVDQSSYQRFDLFSQWKQRFENAGFKLKKFYGFAQPELNPSASYLKYKALLRQTGLARFAHYAPVKKIISLLARKTISANQDFVWEGKEEDILKIMVYR